MNQTAAQDKIEATTVPAASPGAAALEEIDDCWNRIGVEGDGSCPKLETFIHCRNCQVYAAAGAQLLSRALPPDYRREWAEHFAQSKKRSPLPRTSTLVFRIGAEWFALPTPAFQEVAEKRPFHSLPHRRSGLVLGLVNVRGELLACISLGRVLGLEPTVSRKTPGRISDWLLVTNWDGNRLAFPVDEVCGVHRFSAPELKEPPATVAKAAFAFTRGIFLWRDRTVGYLDADLLFAALSRSLT